MFCRSVSDVPIKIQQLAVTVSNTKSVYKIMAQNWREINNDKSDERDTSENPFGTDFMMHPEKLYKISFVGEQCQFSENSMLSVSILTFIHSHFPSTIIFNAIQIQMNCRWYVLKLKWVRHSTM